MKKPIAAACLAAASLTAFATPAQARDGYHAEVFVFAGNFCPRGSLPADGRLLSISENTALFSLLGTMYGGDGRTTFGLPNLRHAMVSWTSNGDQIPMRYCVVTEGVFPSRY
jgi:microcystin-dependent protein